MSAIACNLYRIEVDKAHALELLAELELMRIFEPMEPMFPIDQDEYKQLLLSVVAQREKCEQAMQIFTEVLGVEKQVGGKTNISLKSVGQLSDYLPKLELAIGVVQERYQQYKRVTKEITRLQQFQEQLLPLQEVMEPIFARPELLNSRVVKLSLEQHASLQRSLLEVEQIEVVPVIETEQGLVLLLLYSDQVAPAVEKMIADQQLGVIDVSVFSHAQSPAEASADLESLLDKSQRELDKVIKELVKLRDEELSHLRTWHDLLLLQFRSIESLQFVGYSPGLKSNVRRLSASESEQIKDKVLEEDSLVGTIVDHQRIHIDGWMDGDQVVTLEKRLKTVSKDLRIHALAAEDDPEVRTVLHNNALLKPFELITTLMGTPHPSEQDPSPFVAPFFVVFFGFALGDAGYGIMMAAVLLWLMRRQDLPGKAKDALLLMLYCSFSTIIFGILTGGWFGLDLAAIGSIGVTLQSFKMIDLQSNIMFVLGASLIMGFIHQLFGLTLACIGLWKAGKPAEALQKPGTWLLLLLTIAAVVISNSQPAASSLQQLTTPLVIFSLAAFIWGQGMGAKSLWLRPLQGMASLFGITSYLSNTLSYARLLALALATGVIGSVVNMIALMFGSDVPVIGVFITGAILIIGHTFNIMLNLLGTFINVARLHLVEFFPRFFEARGTELTPMRVEPVYSSFADDLTGKSLAFNKVIEIHPEGIRRGVV
jgi:vacuolar-type H+-ATPase subunit I/STV1